MTRLAALLLVLVLGATIARAQAPAMPNQVLTRIAFGSCSNQEREQPIWDAISAYKPELFIFAGDNVYGDIRNGKPVSDDAELLETLTTAYGRAALIPGMARLRAATPHLATWDDHDYGKNDAGEEFIHKQAAQRLFNDFWKLPQDDPRRQRAGVYHAQSFGPPGKRVQVILLDTRSFRSALKPTDTRNAKGRERYVPDDSADKTMLGAAQWAWLEQQLKEPAELRLIVSSIQVIADGHGWERWGNFPRERQKLYDLIGATKANRVVFLSGDRHIGALYRETRGTPYPLSEITGSGLTQFFSNVNEDGPNRLGAPYGAVNFGALDIDWWEETLHVSLRNMNGETVRRMSLPFGEMVARGG
ncbi:MAG: alkaline phosphatase D family protein [Beijerinckiaceae bacterium]